MNRIKVLHLITELEPGGAENLLLNICRQLGKKNFNILVGYISGPGTLSNQIRNSSVRVIDLTNKGKIDFLLLFRLIFLMRKERIKIVHTHLVHASIVGRVAAKLAGVKIILTTRHYAYDPKEKSFMRWLERRLAVFNMMTIAISKAVRDYLIRKENYDSKKVTLIYNTVDLGLFDLNGVKESVTNSDNYLIGSVGRLHPSKGHSILIQSMSTVIREFRKTRLLIIGSGSQRMELENLARELKISEHVTFLGLKSPAEVIEIIRDVDLFVLASNWEGFGIAVIEAMALCKPVVVTAVEGLREVIEDGRTGFLVPPGNPHALAERIIYLLKNRDLSVEMGKEGRKRVEALFSLDNMIMKLERLYQDLLT
ncbi:MAG: glycosyltransferase [candidate division Zixibacteria bacterium]|nr:glycosyltransferase [candidate division Zixibacteria bacterium]